MAKRTDEYLARLAQKPIGQRRNYTPAPKHPLPWPPMGGSTKPLDPGPAQPPGRPGRRRLVQPWENSRNFA